MKHVGVKFRCKYRDLKDEETAREAKRQYMARRRAKEKQIVHMHVNAELMIRMVTGLDQVADHVAALRIKSQLLVCRP